MWYSCYGKTVYCILHVYTSFEVTVDLTGVFSYQAVRYSVYLHRIPINLSINEKLVKFSRL